MNIRPETQADVASIRSVTTAAFALAEHSSGTEAAIVDALRDAGALELSLVAEIDGAVVGHVGFSPVRIDGVAGDWFGLGPVSVLPAVQRRGVGSALIRQGLDLLRSRGATGCVVLGDPRYYGRFGFSSNHGLRYGDVPRQSFQSLVLSGPRPTGEVRYHAGFDAA